MSVAITDGVLGVEAVHEFHHPAGGPAVRFNDWMYGLPYFLVRHTTVGSRSEADDNRDQSLGQVGELPYPSLMRGANRLYEGVLMAQYINDARALANLAKSRMIDTSNEGLIRVIPDPVWGSVVHYYYGRVAQFDIDDIQPTSDRLSPRFQIEYSLTIRQSDPRFYVEGPVTSAAAASGDTVTVNNAGLAPTEMVITGSGLTAGLFGAVSVENLDYPTGVGHATLIFNGVTGAGSVVIGSRPRRAEVGRQLVPRQDGF
jgi:hypothetical protein